MDKRSIRERALRSLRQGSGGPWSAGDVALFLLALVAAILLLIFGR